MKLPAVALGCPAVRLLRAQAHHQALQPQPLLLPHASASVPLHVLQPGAVPLPLLLLWLSLQPVGGRARARCIELSSRHWQAL